MLLQHLLNITYLNRISIWIQIPVIQHIQERPFVAHSAAFAQQQAALVLDAWLRQQKRVLVLVEAIVWWGLARLIPALAVAAPAPTPLVVFCTVVAMVVVLFLAALEGIWWQGWRVVVHASVVNAILECHSVVTLFDHVELILGILGQCLRLSVILVVDFVPVLSHRHILWQSTWPNQTARIRGADTDHLIPIDHRWLPLFLILAILFTNLLLCVLVWIICTLSTLLASRHLWLTAPASLIWRS